jgi:hypothetical protein
MEQVHRFSSQTVLNAILLLGLIVGSLDISSAIVDYYIATGKGPAGIFKYISSAILDKEAFSGGTGTLLLGLFLHYLIAFLFTIFFVLLYVKTNLFRRNKFLVGVLYGVFIWAVMNFIIVPISHTPKGPFVLWKSIKAMLILIFMIGLPLAFLTGRFLKKHEAA